MRERLAQQVMFHFLVGDVLRFDFEERVAVRHDQQPRHSGGDKPTNDRDGQGELYLAPGPRAKRNGTSPCIWSSILMDSSSEMFGTRSPFGPSVPSWNTGMKAVRDELCFDQWNEFKHMLHI